MPWRGWRLPTTACEDREPDHEEHIKPDIAPTTGVIYEICAVALCQHVGGGMDVRGVDEVPSVATVIFVLLSKS